MHQLMAETLESVFDEIQAIQKERAPEGNTSVRLADDRNANPRKAGPGRSLSTANQSKIRGERTKFRSPTLRRIPII